MENEKIIEKIRKLFALSENNPSEDEAKAAALKAQELLAQYNIAEADIREFDTTPAEEICEIRVDLAAKKWKYDLATAVANNFRCKRFYFGKSCVCFYGHKTDATVAAETFKYLFKTGNILAGREVDRVFKETGTSRDVYNSFCRGFCVGIKQVLDEQCTALMLVTPTDVEEGYAKRSKHMGQLHYSYNRGVYRDVYENGIREGRSAMNSRKLEA